jgi:ABC-type transporter MlaC component
MKKLVVVALALFLGVSSYAQDSEFSKMMREMYADEFKEIMMENINLTEAQMTIFKPIFDEFIGDLSGVMDKKLATQGKFAKYFDGMTDEQVKTILKEVVDNSKSYTKVIEKYTKKVGNELNPQTAFRFYLIVEKVKATIDYPLIQNIPLVEN